MQHITFLLISLTWVQDSSLQLLPSCIVLLYRNCLSEEMRLDFLSCFISASDAWIYHKNRRIKAHLVLSFNFSVPSKPGIWLCFYSLATLPSVLRHTSQLFSKSLFVGFFVGFFLLQIAVNWGKNQTLLYRGLIKLILKFT